MPTFLWLEWPRAVNGYRICEPEPDVFDFQEDVPADEEDVFLAPEDDEIVIYRPMEESPGLFMEFAHIEPTPAGAQQFANRHGLLWEKPKGQIEDEMTIGDWFKYSRRMRKAVQMWEASRKSGNIAPLIEAISARPWLQAGVYLQAVVEHPTRASLHLKADDLHESMWLQFVGAVSMDAQLRRCAHCPSWIMYGSGTGRRESAVYCSTACRRAAAKAKKESKE